MKFVTLSHDITSLKIQPLTPNLLPILKMSFELNGLL